MFITGGQNTIGFKDLSNSEYFNVKITSFEEQHFIFFAEPWHLVSQRLPNDASFMLALTSIYMLLECLASRAQSQLPPHASGVSGFSLHCLDLVHIRLCLIKMDLSIEFLLATPESQMCSPAVV